MTAGTEKFRFSDVEFIKVESREITSGPRPVMRTGVRAGDIATCSYCGSNAPSWHINDVAERVYAAFDQHFVPCRCLRHRQHL
jgi:hypothetical protein